MHEVRHRQTGVGVHHGIEHPEELVAKRCAVHASKPEEVVEKGRAVAFRVAPACSVRRETQLDIMKRDGSAAHSVDDDRTYVFTVMTVVDKVGDRAKRRGGRKPVNNRRVTWRDSPTVGAYAITGRLKPAVGRKFEDVAAEVPELMECRCARV